MSPRIIHIPLSGGDRKAQAKGIRYAHGIHNSYFKESVLIRSAAEAKIREADRLECEAWNAIMWAGGPAMPFWEEDCSGRISGPCRQLRPKIPCRRFKEHGPCRQSASLALTPKSLERRKDHLKPGLCGAFETPSGCRSVSSRHKP